jgi:cardiolipin synthase
MNIMTLLLLAHLAVAIPVCLHILLTKHEATVPSWLALVLISPFLGALFYWILGINRIQRRARKLRGGHQLKYVPQLKDPPLPFADLPTAQQSQLFHYDVAVHDAPFVGGNRVTPLIGADEAFPNMLAAITSARTTIALSVYIFECDDIGSQFVDALKAAHARGIDIYVLVDEIGSGRKSRAADEALAANSSRW